MEAKLKDGVSALKLGFKMNFVVGRAQLFFASGFDVTEIIALSSLFMMKMITLPTQPPALFLSSVIVRP